ncbi:hypothetical protein ACFYU9_16890 [Streptomyces sp. NPDC004327]|uniref:hypothetical protein n=1 Tax=unclassified Streptomyces TaxID=2593676 RepID=UPI0036A5F00C
MSPYIAMASAVVGIALAICGTAALSTGWILPWLRGQVVRPRLHGSAQLVMAAALLTQAGSALADDPDLRVNASVIGTGTLLVGLLLLFASQLRPFRR